MKGPGLRLDLDVRRVWRCRTCQTERHVPGHITMVACHFCQDHPLMSLMEPQRSRRDLVGPPDMVIALHPDDIDAPAYVPVHLREPDADGAIVDPASDAVESEVAVEDSSIATQSSSLPALAEPAAPQLEPNTETADAPQPRKKRRKKNRRRKERTPAKDAATSARPPAANDNDSTARPTASEDSFGAGIESFDT